MKSVVLAFPADWAGWRQAARALAAAAVAPDQVVWSVGAPSDLLADACAAADEPPDPSPHPDPSPAFTVPRAFVDLAETVIMARDPERFALLYTLLWRIRSGEKALMHIPTDPLLARLDLLAHAVRRDIHKMRAFLRFREVTDPSGTRHVAWFEPDHHILEANAPFFVRRFATMAWSILTPERSAHWDGEHLHLGPGATRADLPDDDRFEEFWRAYYVSIFNPARLKVSAMLSEMPRKYWRNLPEARAIPDLMQSAAARATAMIDQAPTAPRQSRSEQARPAQIRPEQARPEPATASPLAALSREAAACRACKLWEQATQTVFGEGPEDAAIMLLGEQPGDQEDLAGRPFVGPAGQVLDSALHAAGLDRTRLYVTNSVKHFKFVPRGKRRIHEKPTSEDIDACRFWLDRERAVLRPRLIVALGATAARALLGRSVTISRERGQPMALGPHSQGLITIHPSFLLRLPDEDSKQREYRAFLADLRLAASLAA